MKLIRFGDPGRERPGLQLDNGDRVDASAFCEDYGEAFFGDGGLDRLRKWSLHEAARAPRLAEDTRIGSPVARPSKLVCIGLNYKDHAAESNMPLPGEPVIFFKATTAVCGPFDPVRIPAGGTKLDWEVELACVIGGTARNVSRDDATKHIAGYVLHNDYSERSFQLERGGQWVKGKSCDTFAPLGPFMATPDEIADPSALGLWLTVNGATRQKSSTAQMIFDVPTLVSYISGFMTLLPGDVISTGTPPGVGLGMKPEPVYLKRGDVVVCGIDGLGEARQVVQ